MSEIRLSSSQIEGSSLKESCFVRSSKETSILSISESSTLLEKLYIYKCVHTLSALYFKGFLLAHF